MAQEMTGNGDAQLARILVAALRDQTFLPQIYPSLFDQGVDEGALHSYMLSALVLVGDRLGFSPVSDSPVFDRLDKLLMGEGAKRPDAVWFTRGQHEIRCLIEFERYSIRSLAPKAKNLLIMVKELHPPPHLVVLNYWTYSSVPTDALQEVQSIFVTGFRHVGGILFPPPICPTLVLETIVAMRDGRTRVHAVLPRLYLRDGEDKPYSVEQLNRA